MTAVGWIPAPVPDPDPGFAGMTKLPVLCSYAKVSLPEIFLTADRQQPGHLLALNFEFFKARP